METRIFRVQGMTCGGCAKHVEKALRAVPEVETATVDLAKGTVAVQGTASVEAMAMGLSSAGYELVGPA